MYLLKPPLQNIELYLKVIQLEGKYLFILIYVHVSHFGAQGGIALEAAYLCNKRFHPAGGVMLISIYLFIWFFIVSHSASNKNH